jgi:phenylacetate-CoA ligase
VDLTVVSPCFDEAGNVRELARRVLATLERGGLEGELVLVDDGSRDETRERIEQLAAEHPGRVVALHHPENRGIAEAWRTGVAAARAPLVAVIDSDLQYQPEDLLTLHRELCEHGVDVVQGWRSATGRERGPRYVLSRSFSHVLNRTFGMRLRDNKSGFVLASRRVFEDLLAYRGRYRYWQSFVMVAAHAKGYRQREVEVLFEPRRQGQSFLDGATARATARSIVDLGRAVREYRFGPPAPRRSPHWRAYLLAFDSLHWVITREVERHYEGLQLSQWWSPDALRDHQDEQLRQLVRHAYHAVPYYRERFRECRLVPEDIRGQADLHKLPLLTKDDVRRYLHAGLLADDVDRREMLRITTSGSTGEPLVCYADRMQLEARWAATLRGQEWTGYRFGERSARLWHQALGMTRRQARLERLDAAFCRRRFVPVFELSDDRLGSWIAELGRWDPVLLDGYAEALVLMASYLASRGSHGLGPRAVLSSAQTLPPSSRALVEAAFGCPVFDKYGAREFSGIAYECDAHAGHHVVEGYLVEILRNGQPVGPGETGEIVVTDLHNRCLPFIRYRIGDLGVAMDPAIRCPCGRGLPLLGAIEGRVQSIISGKDGRYVPGTFFAHYLKDFDHAIRRFQVRQDEPGRIRLRLVRADRYSESALEEILGTFRRVLGDLEVDVELLDAIPLGNHGKHLDAISSLPIDFQRHAPPRAAVGGT